MYEYLKDFTCITSLFGYLVVTCDETEDTQENVVVNTSNRRNYWLIAVVLLVRDIMVKKIQNTANGIKSV